jgi:antitoxin VapB
MKEYHVKLIQHGNQQTLPIPTELTLDTPFVIIRQENNKLIIEPSPKKSLIEVLSTLEPLDEDFPDIDEGLLPLDDIDVVVKVIMNSR